MIGPIRVALGIALVAATTTLGCSRAGVSSAHPDTTNDAMKDVTKDAAKDVAKDVTKDGLTIWFDVPPGPHRAGENLALVLHMRNARKTPLRIYMIRTEAFRSFQSRFTLFDASGAAVDTQPPPHPHGYVVTEDDFVLLAPGETRVFEQHFVLKNAPPPAESGAWRLRWTYENEVSSWPGGRPTLDGPTRALWDGGPIPDIWLGRIDIDAPLG